MPNRSQHQVKEAIIAARQRLHFSLLGLDSDNGGEFLNTNLKHYCEQEHITFTRSRPYKKNDQAHVEQKNRTLVRQFVGYGRFEGQTACSALEALYEPMRRYMNFFQPTLKLVRRDGCQRLLLSPEVREENKPSCGHCMRRSTRSLCYGNSTACKANCGNWRWLDFHLRQRYPKSKILT